MRSSGPKTKACPVCGEICRAAKDLAGRYECRRCGAIIEQKQFRPEDFSKPRAGIRKGRAG